MGAVLFDEDEVRPMGRSARGVRGVKLEDDGAVAGMAAVDESVHDWLLTVTRQGYGKRTEIENYRVQGRNGKGLIDIKTSGRNGPVCAVETVCPGDHLVTMSEGGQIMRTRVEDISVVGRNTMGVIVMDVEEDDRVASVDVIPEAIVTEENVELDEAEEVEAEE